MRIARDVGAQSGEGVVLHTQNIEPRAKPLRVFIVDDDQDFAKSLALLIRRRGHEVELAYSGEAAIERFRQQDASNERPFDITFMDVKLPGKNGVRSFMEIRQFNPTAKVVMMTGYSVEQLLEQAVEQGAWGVLTKPLDLQKLIEMIERIKPGGILIVDDNPEFVEIVKYMLVRNGYKVFAAGNGREAIERIRSTDIDILVLDLHLPILGGLDTYLELRKIGYAIPTLIVTAYADQNSEAIDKLRSLAVEGILKKPFPPNELLDAVDRLSRQRGVQAEQKE